ncbi:MAG: flagellin [Alkalilacustris sp.]
MSLTPAGDMANALFLRRQTATLKSALTRHSQELTTGKAADPLRKLRGDTVVIASLERSRLALEAYEMATIEAELHTANQQRVLERLRVQGMDVGGQLLLFGTAVPAPMIDTAGRMGRGAFEDAISALNTQVGGRYIFSGVQSDKPALASADHILAELRVATAGATSAAEVAQIVFDWFTPGHPNEGFMAEAFTLDATAKGPVALSPNERITMTATAARPELRELLGGLALAALVVEEDATGTVLLDGRPEERAQLLASAGLQLASAPVGVTALAGELGDTEARIEAARTRNANERTALELALNRLVAVDSYDAAVRLEETRVRIESLFTLTARLQRMSLTEFLR